jgi:hypothetical protein
VNRLFNNFKILKNYFFQNIYLDSIEKKFITFNKKKWKSYNNLQKKIILIDLFPWYPWIYFWSYLVNILAKKENAQIKFFYFNLYDNFFSSFRFYIYKLTKIFSSFNALPGVTEYDLVPITNYKKKLINNLFKKFIKSKKNAVNFKYKKILIGDLIYDTYLRKNFSPTINLFDPNLKKIFYKAIAIFDLMEIYFKKNKVSYIVPSQTAYIPYGIPIRVANKFRIRVIKIRTENRGLSLFQLIKLDKYLIDEMPYYNFKKTFRSISANKHKYMLSIGKNLIKNRLSGSYDEKLPYMDGKLFQKKNGANPIYKIKKFDLKKKTIIIFPHCFYDHPHRFRSMIFNDFFEHAKYFLDQSKILKSYNWIYKSHPNELDGNKNYHAELSSLYPDVIFLDKNTNHYDLLNLNLRMVITNHGTLAHEYAYFKVPVINTGDNPHINYNFCLNIKTKKELDFVMKNLDTALSRINFSKKNIYEFMFLNYQYYKNLYSENKFIKDSYFVDPILKNNFYSKVLAYHIKNDRINEKNITSYINNFIKNVY